MNHWSLDHLQHYTRQVRAGGMQLQFSASGNCRCINWPVFWSAARSRYGLGQAETRGRQSVGDSAASTYAADIRSKGDIGPSVSSALQRSGRLMLTCKDTELSIPMAPRPQENQPGSLQLCMCCMVTRSGQRTITVARNFTNPVGHTSMVPSSSVSHPRK